MCIVLELIFAVNFIEGYITKSILSFVKNFSSQSSRINR